MKRRVLFISSWFPNKIETTNGNFVQRHAEAVALLHDVEVLHAIGDFSQKETFVFEEKIEKNVRILIVYYRNSKNPIQNFLRRMKAYSIGFKKMNFPDILHCNILRNNIVFAVWLKKRYGIPFVASEHWNGFQISRVHQQSWLTKKMAKWLGNHASYLLPVSEDLQKGLLEIGIKKPMEIVSNVVDTELFKPIENENDVFNFLHISNLIPLKNFDKIIEAADQLYLKNKNFILNIGGDGSEVDLKKLEKLSAGKPYIKVFGEISHREVAQKMQRADAFILFSDIEGQPCVVLEALACGTPVISSNVGTALKVISDEEKGIVVEKNNVKELEEAMYKMLINKQKADKKKLHNYVEENFSNRSVSMKIDEIYQNAKPQIKK